MLDIKNKIEGAFQLILLVGRGIKKFTGTKADGLKSFIIPVALLPVSIWFALTYPPKGMETGFSGEAIGAFVIAHFMISFIFTMCAISGVAYMLKRMDRFWLFIEACNWTSVGFSIVAVPLMIAAIFGYFSREEMDRLFAMFEIYGYVVTACIAWRAFDLNWQLAGAISVLTLFVSQETSHMLYMMLGAPIWTGLE